MRGHAAADHGRARSGVELRLTKPTVIDVPMILKSYESTVTVDDVDDFANGVYDRIVEVIEPIPP